MLVNFITPTKISLIDITSMGDSSKREDEKTLGMFDSGLKYSIALLLRAGVNLSISTNGEDIIHESYDEPTIETYNFDTYLSECTNTGKKKELIKVICTNTPLGGHAMSQYDMREPSASTEEEIKTGFAKNLGHNWELWMALRELWSNMLDEGGYVVEGSFDELDVNGTIVTLEFDETNVFYEVWVNKHLYINQSEPLFILSDSVECLSNEEGYLRIYKQNILVYENKEKPSRFAWNIKFGTIDERRILSNVYQVEQEIANSITQTTNREFLESIITKDFEVKEKEFLSSNSGYYGASSLINDIAYDVYSKYGDVKSYEWLIKKVKERKDCKIGGKIITTVEDSLWSYSTEVSVETSPQTVSEPDLVVDEVPYISTFSAQIKEYYNFDLDVEVKIAKLKGSKVVADKYEKCLIIDESFSVEEHFHDFIVQYIDLTQKGNVVENLSRYICELIKK